MGKLEGFFYIFNYCYLTKEFLFFFLTKPQLILNFWNYYYYFSSCVIIIILFIIHYYYYCQSFTCIYIQKQFIYVCNSSNSSTCIYMLTDSIHCVYIKKSLYNHVSFVWNLFLYFSLNKEIIIIIIII